ncbi:MAG: hypothetical protein CMJ18_11445 [Phycisphaeraceae bacterium]|nr:hypothetical protein [Phycisphaeraceae bacterium]
MKIAIVSTDLRPVPVQTWGGIEGQVQLQSRALAGLGHDAHVLTVGGGDDTIVETLDRVRYHRLGRARVLCANRSVGGLAAGAWRFARRVRTTCRELRPDLVHFHCRYPCLAAFVLDGRRSRTPWRRVFHAHNWKQAEQMSYPWLGTRRAAAFFGAGADRGIARRCDHLVTISGFMKQRITETSCLTPDRVSVVTNVVDIRQFHPAPESVAAPEILFVGRIAAEKGLGTLIEAMPSIVERLPTARLRVLGPALEGTERGGYQQHCRSLVETLGIADHVEFVGEVPNHRLPEYLRRARILVVPSIWGEPCGVAVLEGMACGVPVVASRVGGIPELLEEGRTGLLVPPGDAQALGRAAVRALTDDALARSAHEHGPLHIARNHTSDAIQHQLEEIYERVMQG